jgi:hypothetical protein
MSNTDTDPADESTDEQTEATATDPVSDGPVSNDSVSNGPVSDDTASTDREADLAAQIDLLAAENRRLRELVADSQRRRYRGTALALCGVGLLCGLLGYVTPAALTVLFALGGTGVFGGVLTYFLTPERFISADVGRRVYTATADSFERLSADLGLSDRRVYVSTPTDDASSAEETTSSWLFVPQTEETTVPESTAFDSALVVEDDQRGLALRPTGSGLFAAVTGSLTEPLGTTVDTLCAQLSDAVVEDFELAQTVEYETDPADGRVSVRISGALYGEGSRFDHPLVSLLAVGLSTGLETPIETTVTGSDPLAVTFRWEPAEDNQ